MRRMAYPTLNLLKLFVSLLLIAMSLSIVAPAAAIAQSASTEIPKGPPGNRGQSTPEGLAITNRGTAALQANNGAEGRRLMQQACNLNTAIGCYGLAVAYSDARWGAVNKVESSRYYLRGCELGSGVSCFSAGTSAEETQKPEELVKARNFLQAWLRCGEWR